MSAFQPGDIILLDFPFSNRQGSKYRPGLVLAPSDFGGDYIVAYITSNADLALLYSCPLYTSDAADDLTRVGLGGVRRTCKSTNIQSIITTNYFEDSKQIHLTVGY